MSKNNTSNVSPDNKIGPSPNPVEPTLGDLVLAIKDAMANCVADEKKAFDAFMKIKKRNKNALPPYPLFWKDFMSLHAICQERNLLPPERYTFGPKIYAASIFPELIEDSSIDKCIEFVKTRMDKEFELRVRTFSNESSSTFDYPTGDGKWIRIGKKLEQKESADGKRAKSEEKVVPKGKQNPAPALLPVKYRPSNKNMSAKAVKFYCAKCYERKQIALIGCGYTDYIGPVPMDGVENDLKDERKRAAENTGKEANPKGTFRLKMCQIFCHDVDCDKPVPSSKLHETRPINRTLNDCGYVKMTCELHFLSEDYDKMIQRLDNDYKWEPPNWSRRKNLSTSIKGYHPSFWMYQMEYKVPPGAHINFGKPGDWENGYKFDDRTYEPLPSPDYPEIEIGTQVRMEACITYRITTKTNASKEAMFWMPDYAIDKDTYEKEVAAARNAILDGTTNAGNLQDLQYCCPVKFNPDAHLHCSEPGAITGGNQMAGDECIHQKCHMDLANTDNTDSFQEDVGKDKSLPGAWIKPLEDYRTIYIHNAMNTVKIYESELLFFQGHIPHGGITYSAEQVAEEKEAAKQEGEEIPSGWHPALHGHLDSICLVREKNALAHFTSRMDQYLPKEHLPFIEDEALKEIVEILDPFVAAVYDELKKNNRAEVKAEMTMTSTAAKN